MFLDVDDTLLPDPPIGSPEIVAAYIQHLWRHYPGCPMALVHAYRTYAHEMGYRKELGTMLRTKAFRQAVMARRADGSAASPTPELLRELIAEVERAVGR